MLRGMAKTFSLWKALGLAGVIGTVVTGAAIARAERERRAYSPDEIRDRLHRRLAETKEHS